MTIEIKFELNGKIVPISKVKHLVSGVSIYKDGNFYHFYEQTKEKYPNYSLGSGSGDCKPYLVIFHELKDGKIIREDDEKEVPDGYLNVVFYGLHRKKLGSPTMSVESSRYGLKGVLYYYGKQTEVASVVAKGR